MTGRVYLVGALLLGRMVSFAGVRVAFNRTLVNARKVLLVSRNLSSVDVRADDSGPRAPVTARFALMACLLLAGCSRETPLPVLGQVPGFTLTAQTGQAFNGSSLLGRVGSPTSSIPTVPVRVP